MTPALYSTENHELNNSPTHSSHCLVRIIDFPDNDTKIETLASIYSQSLLNTQHFPSIFNERELKLPNRDMSVLIFFLFFQLQKALY